VLFLAARVTSLFSQAIAESVQTELLKYGLSMSLQVGTESHAVRNAIDTLSQHSADGLIVETNDDHIDELHNAAANGHAIVAIGATSGDQHFDVISSDIAGAVRQAMMHLCDRGFRHFVLLSSHRDLSRDHRMSIASAALRSTGATADNVSVIYCPHDRVGAYRAASSFLGLGDAPVAVYAGSDVSATGVLWAALHLGLRVPEDVAIVGHGNSPETEITLPPLTSIGPVSPDFSQAAELIASRMKKPSLAGRHVIQPCELTIRESTSNVSRTYTVPQAKEESNDHSFVVV
jgi:LacI family transcriptional regulator